MYPTTNEVYVPSFTDEKRKVTLDEAKTGRIVAISDDNTRATVEVKIGTQIVYCGVLLNEDGTIKDFIPRPINTFKSVGYAVGKMDMEYENPPE